MGLCLSANAFTTGAMDGRTGLIGYLTQRLAARIGVGRTIIQREAAMDR